MDIPMSESSDIVKLFEHIGEATVSRVNESLAKQEKSMAERDAALRADMNRLRHDVEQGQADLRREVEQGQANLRLEAEQREARQFKAYIGALATAVIIIIGTVGLIVGFAG